MFDFQDTVIHYSSCSEREAKQWLHVHEGLRKALYFCVTDTPKSKIFASSPRYAEEKETPNTQYQQLQHLQPRHPFARHGKGSAIIIRPHCHLPLHRVHSCASQPPSGPSCRFVTTNCKSGNRKVRPVNRGGYYDSGSDNVLTDPRSCFLCFLRHLQHGAWPLSWLRLLDGTVIH